MTERAFYFRSYLRNVVRSPANSLPTRLLPARLSKTLGIAGLGLLAGLAGCSEVDSAVAVTADAQATAQIESAVVNPAVGAPTDTFDSVAADTSLPATAAVPAADSFAAAWGPAIGSTIPLLAANDHTGQARDLASLSGDRGLLLVFSRSADW